MQHMDEVVSLRIENETLSTENTAFAKDDGLCKKEETLRVKLHKIISYGRRICRIACIAAMVLGYFVYVGFCLLVNPGRSVFVCLVAVLLGLVVVNKATKGRLAAIVNSGWTRLRQRFRQTDSTAAKTRRIATLVCSVAVVVFLIYDIQDQWQRYVPLTGLVIVVLTSVIFSTDYTKIRWLSVAWGFLLQFGLGLLILRWQVGFSVCHWMGNQITQLLSYADAGSKFVFGAKYTDHPMAFQIFPGIVFFNALVQVLYYLGVMQLIIKSIALVLQTTMGTSPIESYATSAHIFIGLAESITTLRPFMLLLTTSEVHVVMASASATISGSHIAAFVSFGIPAEHIITASVLSAPAALAICKISLPETEESKIKTSKDLAVATSTEVNVIEALSAGAISAIKIVAYTCVNIIAFQALLAFLDHVMNYLGSIIDFPQLSFQMICAYICMPVGAVIGVPWSECFVFGALLGKKLAINIYLAYVDLGNAITADNLSSYTTTVATYCLCGFSGFLAVGVILATLSSAVPARSSEFARLVIRAVLNGNLANIVTACIAGLLFQEPSTSGLAMITTTMMAPGNNVSVVFNSTSMV